MRTIRILADDLTGALDSAAAFDGEIPVFIDCPPKDVDTGISVSVVATPTRDVPLEELSTHLQPVLAWLKSGDIAFKKVDSLLRGNTFAEVAWLINAGGFASTVFAPAFPAQGRVTVSGQQWVIEPGNPSGLRTPTALPFGKAFGDLGDPADIWAPDVVADRDLDDVVAKAWLKHGPRLWCGSAGLAYALARRLELAQRSGNTPSALTVENNGPTVLVSASHHPVLRKQWKVLASALKPLALVEQASELQIGAALESVRNGAGSVWFDLSPTEQISPELASQLLEKQTARLVAGLPKPAQLIVVGGDTLLGLCRAARVEALLTQPSIRNGWGCARLKGGIWDGVPCYSRSGAFGGADDLFEMIRLLNGGENSMKGN